MIENNDDIFDDDSDKNQCWYGVHVINELDSSLYIGGDTITNKIATLADVFIEWYLFDSNESKNIQTFLQKENLETVFTEQQFLDLLCGNACMDDVLCLLVINCLPFPIRRKKFYALNFMASKNHSVYKIVANETGLGNIMAVLAMKNEQKKIKQKQHQQQYQLAYQRQYRAINHDKILAVQKRYYENNRDKVAEYQKQYRATNRDKLAALQRQYCAKNRDKVAETHKRYCAKNRDKIAEYHKQYYLDNYDKIAEYRKQYYLNNRDKTAEFQKQYYQNNRAKAIAYQKQYYQNNRDNITEKRHNRYTENRDKKNFANMYCPIMATLCNLYKFDKPTFKSLGVDRAVTYKLISKNCCAVQKMDISSCDLIINGLSGKICPGQNVPNVQNIIPAIQKYLAEHER